MAQNRYLVEFHLTVPKRPALALLLLCCVSGFAQTGPPVSPSERQPSKPSAAIAPSAPPVSHPQQTVAPSLLSQPAQPAKISLGAGKLTVEANNSALAEILHQISEDGGMKIEGLGVGDKANQRVFGTYGPGAPRDVLSELLDGSGYNVLMLGANTSGVPRELTLTLKNGGSIPNPPQSASNAREQYEQDEIQPTIYPKEQENHPAPPPVSPGMRNGVRTSQQILEELQRMRQQQNQQDQPDQEDQPDQPN
jgi:hypothetical protein